MSLLDSRRSRAVVATTALLVAAVFGVLFARQIAQVHAAQQAMAIQDALIAASLESPTDPQPGASPVLVELFTSEGCSSCPPADALLARLSHDQPIPNADIITLGEHVDYWDSLGWHDRFSSHDLTLRQSQYEQRLHLDDSYTPQMVVDGTDQFVGNDSARALRAIANAAHAAKLPITLSGIAADQNHLAAVVSVALASKPLPNADLYAALVQPNASTQVLHGENGGHTLQHVSVVRKMQRIGNLSAASTTSLKFSFEAPKDVPLNGLRVVVFIQRPADGAILGAASSTATASSSRTTAVASR